MPGHCSWVDYYHSNPSSSCIEETHKRIFEKSMVADIDLEWNPFPFEDDFFAIRKKWLCEKELSQWMSDFNLKAKKAIEKEPSTFSCTDRIALEMETSPFHKTIRRFRQTTAGRGDSFAVQRIVEKAQFRRDELVQDLADRVTAMEMSVEKLKDLKAKKDTKPEKAKPLPCTVKKSFKKEWKGDNGVKGKLSCKWEESKNKVTDPITITIPGPRQGEFKTIRVEKYTVINDTKSSDAKIRVIPLEEGDGSSSSSSSHTDDEEASKKIQGVLAKRRAAANGQLSCKGKKKELSPQDAAVIIQTCFREYLVRRSQNLCSLRDLAIAKSKLKELRSLFTNYAYRRHLCRDAEEKQRFSEKTIVLLLTVDSIEGSNHLVREARRSMIQELESMLDAVDPQSPNKGAACSSRRKFDLPEAAPPQKEMDAEVAQVVTVVEEENVASLFS